MADDELRALERRWHETGAEVDRAAWHAALERHGQEPPAPEAVDLVFDEDEHTWSDGRPVGFDSPGREGPVGKGLFFEGPKGRALIRRHCYAFEKDGPWGQYSVGCQAELFRLVDGYVVRFGPLGFKANSFDHHYVSRDQGQTWAEEPEFDATSLEGRRRLVRVVREGEDGPEVW